jgi:23S rRNA (guanosine2251-2'-O)-methyltransferase
VVEAERRKLDAMSRTHAHQGVIAVAAVREYASVDDILARAAAAGRSAASRRLRRKFRPAQPGAIIRTAEAAGAHGVVIPKRRARASRRSWQDLGRRGLPPAVAPRAEPASPARGT